MQTEYTWMTTSELLAMATLRDTATTMERELAHRLSVAVDMLDDCFDVNIDDELC